MHDVLGDQSNTGTVTANALCHCAGREAARPIYPGAEIDIGTSQVKLEGVQMTKKTTKMTNEVKDALEFVLVPPYGLEWEKLTNRMTTYCGEHEEPEYAALRILAAEVRRLRAAIDITLTNNAHLADGDNCTLITLKRALEDKPND